MGNSGAAIPLGAVGAHCREPRAYADSVRLQHRNGPGNHFGYFLTNCSVKCNLDRLFIFPVTVTKVPSKVASFAKDIRWTFSSSKQLRPSPGN